MSAPFKTPEAPFAATTRKAISYPSTATLVQGHWSLTDNPHLRDLALDEAFFVHAAQADGDPDGRQDFYDVVMCGPQPFSQPYHLHMGALRLRRRRTAPAEWELEMEEHKILGEDSAHEWMRIRAAFSYDERFPGALIPGRPWTLESWTAPVVDAATAPYAHYRETAVLTPDGREWRREIDGLDGPLRHALPAAGSVTNTWTLPAALGMRAPGPVDGGEFTFLHHAQFPLPGHHLRALDWHELRHPAGHVLRLFGYQQSGTGAQPSYYWVDGNGRLVIARKGILAWLLCAQPRFGKVQA